MLKSFSAQNFRNLKIRDLQFKKINLFIGPNNSGKSNFIDAINYFSELVTSGKNRDTRYDTAFYDVIAEHGYGDVLDRNLSKPGEISMDWVISNAPNKDLHYQLKFQVGEREQFPNDFFITKELLRYNETTPAHITPQYFFDCHEEVRGKGRFKVGKKNKPLQMTTVIDVQSNETVFAQTLKMAQSSVEFRSDIFPGFIEVSDRVKGFFRGFRNYSSTDFNLGLIRQPCEPDNRKYLRPDGANFVNILYHASVEKGTDFLEGYKVFLREIVPQLEDLRIEVQSDGKRQLYLKIGGKEFKLSEMSDGTIKAMLLLVLLVSPDKMTILSLDEPELNLHPAWLQVITNWVLRSDSAEQIFISTHSPEFLDGFTADVHSGEVALFVGNLESDQTIRPLDPRRLDHYIAEGWKLGDLYRVGEQSLGGWPW